MKKTFDVKRLTTLALLTTIALTIFVVESAIPTLVPIPGVKLGLANIVTLFVLKRYKFSDAAIVLAMRIILATIFTGQAVSFIYSVSGGFLCLIVMAAVNNSFFHNLLHLLHSIFFRNISVCKEAHKARKQTCYNTAYHKERHVRKYT